MSSRKRAPRRKRTHQTAHRRAVADSKVRKLIDELRDKWEGTGRIERGERLRELSALGCSTRGLGEELGQSAATVRRHIELANLPEAERNAVKDGASAKKVLQRKALFERRKRAKKRIEDDQKTGRLSDEIAGIIIKFCRGKKRLRLTPVLKADLPTFLTSVAIYLVDFEAKGRFAIKATKRLGASGLVRKARPGKAGERFWMDYQAEWLTNIVWAKATERPVWENALEKAERRAGELDVKAKRTLIQILRETYVRRQALGATPVRRKY
jgi:hypothetical protein